MDEFEMLSVKLGFPNLKTGNRNRENSTARQAISFYLKGKGYKEDQIAKMQGRNRTSIIHQVNTFRSFLSINDPLSVSYWNVIKDI